MGKEVILYQITSRQSTPNCKGLNIYRNPTRTKEYLPMKIHTTVTIFMRIDTYFLQYWKRTQAFFHFIRRIDASGTSFAEIANLRALFHRRTRAHASRIYALTTYVAVPFSLPSFSPFFRDLRETRSGGGWSLRLIRRNIDEYRWNRNRDWNFHVASARL